MIGTRLAHYEITSHLGSGGFGDVYQATDLKLKRSVAIKLLPDALAADPDRISRFRREAQVLASLNHPNIAVIHGFEDAGERKFLVMELVPGDTLQARLRLGPIPVDEALTIAKQVAEALEAAHEKGVIHRDLKPGNVMLTGEGKVKVLAFGLAKACELDPSNPNLSSSPTRASLALTNVGVILGTAAYMSPEQAKGRTIDRRTDIFALGCVLYEMLTGTPAFEGEDVVEIIAHVVTAEPDWTRLPASVSSRVRDLLRLCLEKNTNSRRSDAADVRIDIDEALKAHANVVMASSEIGMRPLWKRAIPVVLGMSVVAALAGGAVWILKPSLPPPAAVTRFSFTLPEGQVLGGGSDVSISPDGSQFVYVANSRLYLKPMGELSSISIQGTEVAQGAGYPVFSPDGRSLAFYSGADKTIKRLSVSGGAAVTIGSTDSTPNGLSWGPDDQVLVGQGSRGIVRVLVNGGNPETIVKVKESEEAEGPQMLPGGDTVLFTLATTFGPDRWDRAQVVAQSLKSGERKVLIEGGSNARYVPTGHLIYAKGGGKNPVWSPDGKELFFMNNVINGQLYSVSIVPTEAGFAVGNPVAQPMKGFRQGTAQRNYDITPDGKQFIVLIDATTSGVVPQPLQIQVVLNWFQ